MPTARASRWRWPTARVVPKWPDPDGHDTAFGQPLRE
jgi:hypothetical protein